VGTAVLSPSIRFLRRSVGTEDFSALGEGFATVERLAIWLESALESWKNAWVPTERIAAWSRRVLVKKLIR